MRYLFYGVAVAATAAKVGAESIADEFGGPKIAPYCGKDDSDGEWLFTALRVCCDSSEI
jgi:hypothetical protein